MAITETFQQQETVLIIDDEVAILESISDLLEDDFHVLTANRATDALELLKTHEVAVILSDQRMPGMTGDQFLREAQKISEATRILITGYTDMEALVNAVNNGQIYAYLSKPWEPEELSLTISKAMDHYTLVRQLSHERNLLHALMDNIPDAIYFKDAEAQFMRINKASAQLLGIDNAALAQGKKQSDFFAPERASKIAEEEQHLLNTGEPIIDRITQVGPSNNPKWVSVTKVPIRNHQNSIVGLVGISRDITARKQMEEQLHLIHEATMDIARSPNLNHALESVLRIVCRTTGSSYGEVWLPDPTKSELRFSGVTYDTLGTFTNFIHLSNNLTFLLGAGLPGKTWKEKRSLFFNSLNQPKQFTRSSIAQKMGIQTGFGVPIMDSGEILAIMIFLRNDMPTNIQKHIDLADTLAGQLGAAIRRKQIETALQESEKRLEGLINHLPNGVCLLDTNCRIVLSNPAAQNYLLQLGLDDNRKMISSLGNIDIDTLLTPRADGLPHELRVEGDEVDVFELTSAPINGAEGIESGHALVIRNVTEERTTRERIQNQYRLASVGQLAAGIAHDFNNILTVMMGSAQLLTLNEKVDDSIKEDLDIIFEQGQRAAQMVRQVLDFSRESKAERSPTDIIPFLKEATKLLTRAIPSDIEILNPIDVSSCTVNANLTQIQQVINNMAINAQHAMPNGGQLTIAVTTNQFTSTDLPTPEMAPGTWLTIAISDTGHGIPPDVIEHIFEPFFTTKPSGEGTGLGLAQSFGIMQEHGGHITLETEVGKGTTFTLYLPVNSEVIEGNNTILPSILKGKGETILHVEDDETVSRITKVMLENLNYNVISAHNGKAALEIFESGLYPIKLILTDVNMPKMNGLDLAQKIRSLSPNMPIIAISGYIPKDGWAPFIPYTNAQLNKPVQISDLANALAKYLNKP